jgi:3-deoxy-D-manno-octulosonic-acid transferase
LLYSALTLLLLPWALLHLLWRARRQPEYLHHWPERLGWFPTAPAPPLIWVHAVSVGETRAAQPLIAALRQRYPNHVVLLTHMTPTGRATAVSLFGDAVTCAYLPYDLPWAAGRFLDHFRPAFGLIVETEIWPNLIAAAGRRDIPVLLVNARLSERSANRYARWSSLAHQALAGLAAVASQGEDDAGRLRALGARQVEVLGNLKYDVAPPAPQLALGDEFRRQFGERPVFLCASTRDGEEELVLDAWQRFGDPGVLLVVVPRHPQRFADVGRLIEQHHFAWQRRSNGGTVAAGCQVWLGDSMGEMFAYYLACDVAFVGGSLLEFGGQNLIEPCAVGKPVLVGPHTFNFAEASREAVAIGAARCVDSAEELVRTAMALLGARAEREQMAAQGTAFAARHRGATERTLALIERTVTRDETLAVPPQLA